MKKLMLVAALALPACANIKTPEDRYYATLTTATAAMNVAQGYADACLERETSDPCYKVLPKVGDAVVALKKAKDQADKVFVTKDSAYYDLSLTATENATNALQTLLKEIVK